MNKRNGAGFPTSKPWMAKVLVFSLLFTYSSHWVQPVQAAAGEGTATIRVGTGGTNASDATYAAASDAGQITVGTKSYIRIDLTVGASDIAANQNNVTVQINTNLFSANSWEVAEEAALADLNAVGEWFVSYTDTDSMTTNNAAINLSASAAVNTGLITIQANQQMDATDILTIFAVAQDNNYDRPAANILIQTDDTGADSLMTIADPPTIETLYAEAEASVTLGANATVGAAGNTTLQLTVPFALDAGDTVGLTFSSAVNVTGVGAAVTGTFENGGEITCNDTAPTILHCTVITGPTATTGTIIMTGITTLYSEAGGVDVGVENEGVLADYIAISLNASITNISAADANASITLANTEINESGNVTLSLTLPFAMDANDTVDITFPTYLDVSNVGAAVTGTLEGGANITCADAAQVVTCTADGNTNASGTIILTGIVVQASGTSNPSVQVENEGNATEDTAVDANAEMTDVDKGQLSNATLSLSSYEKASDASVTVSMTLENDLPDDGKIKINFDGFNLTGANAVSNASNIDGTFTVSDEGNAVVLERNGDGTDTTAGTVISLTFSSVETPTVDMSIDSFTFQTTLSTDDVIDENAEVMGFDIGQGMQEGTGGGGGSGGGGGGMINLSPLTPSDSEDNSTETSPENSEVGFTDIAGHWAKDYIIKLAEMSIVKGKTPTTFAPDDMITRCEFTTIVVRAFQLPVKPVVTMNPFDDLPASNWCAPYAAAAKEAGIVKGVGDNLFAPHQPIDRAQAVTIFIRAGDFGMPKATSTFPDVKDQWFAPFVIRAAELGIVSGYKDGTFGPANKMTRGEAAKVTAETLENL